MTGLLGGKVVSGLKKQEHEEAMDGGEMGRATKNRSKGKKLTVTLGTREAVHY